MIKVNDISSVFHELILFFELYTTLYVRDLDRKYSTTKVYDFEDLTLDGYISAFHQLRNFRNFKEWKVQEFNSNILNCSGVILTVYFHPNTITQLQFSRGQRSFSWF